MATTAAVLLMVAAAAIYCVRKYADQIKAALQTLREETFYNGAVRAIYVAYMQVAVMAAG